MNNISKNKSPEEIYRDYQNNRDNIPSHIYQDFSSKAADKTREEQIHSILQQSKVVINNAPKPSSEPSVLNRLKTFFSDTPSKQWGTALASLMLVAIVAPIFFNSPNSLYGSTAHLSDCSNCATHISNASLTTRGTLLGGNQVSPSAKIAARLGRQSSNLMIASSLDSDEIVNRSAAELTEINVQLSDPHLSQVLLTSPLNASDLINAISTAKESTNNQTIFYAAESLNTANITARAAIENQQNDYVIETFSTAINSYESIQVKTTLQTNLLEQLKSTQLSIKSTQSLDLEKIIEQTNQAISSLGV